jgi:hypothetical protein
MKLPDNPTPEQIKAVVQLIIRSTFTRGSLSVETVDIFQGRVSGIFLGEGVPFTYSIANGAIEYAPVNPSDLPDEDGADFMEDALDFARLKLAGNTKQVKACKKGYACGYTCISQNRNCRKPLPGQAKTAAEWVAKQKDQPTIRMTTIEPLRVTIGKTKSFGGKIWVARITGPDEKHGLARQFMKAQNVEWGKKGMASADFDLDSPGYYHASDGDYFKVFVNDKGAFDNEIVSYQEVRYHFTGN